MAEKTAMDAINEALGTAASGEPDPNAPLPADDPPPSDPPADSPPGDDEPPADEEVDPKTGKPVEITVEPYQDVYSPEMLERMEKKGEIEVVWKRPGAATAGARF